jgi:phospholipid/cholesterol/gamma-HCH transport system substrate-binding protein
METRANYILIGAFTLAGLLGALGFFVWLAKIQIDRQYDYYDVLFENVSGLGRAGEVRFNGLLVGQVISLELSEEVPGKVQVRIEVVADTPVTTRTKAQLQVQGVTGVSFVSLDGGGGTRLTEREPGTIPVIVGERSVVQTLTEGAPNLLAEAQTLMENLVALTGSGNQDFVSGILGNVDRASAQLDQAMIDFASVSNSVANATDEIALFTARLDGIGEAVQTTLSSIDQTLDATRDALSRSGATIDAATGAMQAAERSFSIAETVIADQVPQVVADIGATAADLRGAVTELRAQLGTVVGEIGTGAGLATLRLQQLEGTLAGIETTLTEADIALQSVDSASAQIAALIVGDGTALVAEARTTLSRTTETLDAATGAMQAAERGFVAAEAVIAEQVPQVMADFGATAQAARTMIADLSGPVAAVVEEIGTGAGLATLRLQELEGTFANIDATLAEANIALESVDSASVEFEVLVEGEGAELVADARAALVTLQGSLAAIDSVVAEDVPGMVTDIRGAVQAASTAIAAVSADVTAFTGRLDPLASSAATTLDTATTTLRDASATLARIDTALGDATGMMAAAESAFAGADAVIASEIAPTAAVVRSAVNSLSGAADAVVADLPAITGELRQAIGQASAVVTRVDQAVAQSAGPIADFSRSGLGQIDQFTREARSLVAALESLVRRIERDPARFFLGNRPPTYQR